MIYLPTDWTGYTPDVSDDAAMTAFLAKHPEEIGAELEILRTGGGILIRRKHGRRARQGSHDDVLVDGSSGNSGMASDAGDHEVTG